MDIQFLSSASDFLSKAGKCLERNEARWGLILGLARVVAENPHRYGPADPWFCAITEGDILCAVAVRTPPHKMLLSHVSGGASKIARSLVDAVSVKDYTIPGVAGDKELAERFAALWIKNKKAGINPGATVNQRIYKLTKVKNVPLSPGHLQQAEENDRLLVKRWLHRFYIDTGGSARNALEDDGRFQLSKGWVYFWMDKEPVSMAVKNRPTEHGMAVGYVYTPPELREKGYASSTVAELCRDILKNGYKYCTLYTDLVNPVSNSIYMKIGFKPVGDSVEFTFNT